MCGIAGVCIAEGDRLNNGKCAIDLALLVKNLACQIEERGNHATGIAFSKPTTKTVTVVKRDIAARKFVKRVKLPTDVNTCLIHTRYATQGTPRVNANNHPIISGTVVGIHNGHISNDDQLFSELGAHRQAEVDSEAAFALLNNATTNGVEVTEALKRLRGGYALAWMNSRDGGKRTLHLVRGNSSPLSIGWTRGGSLVFASTLDLLEKAADQSKTRLERTRIIQEGTYLKVRDGAIIHEESFKPYTYSYGHYDFGYRGHVIGSRQSSLFDLEDERDFWDKQNRLDEEAAAEHRWWTDLVARYAHEWGMTFDEAAEILEDGGGADVIDPFLDPTYEDMVWTSEEVAEAKNTLMFDYGYKGSDVDNMDRITLMRTAHACEYGFIVQAQ